MKRTLSTILAAVLALGVLAGCASKPQDAYDKKTPATPAAPAAPAASVTLKIGQLPITEGLPFWVAEQKGYYKEQGVNVELVSFKSANERDAALMSGQIDGMVSDLVAAASLVGTKTAKVHVVSMALGVRKEEAPMGILAASNAGITNIKDLKGKEIAISTNSIMEYVATKLLAENGLTPADVKFTSIPAIPVRLEALLSGQVTAAILPDPLFYLATTKGAKVLADNSKAKQNYYQSVIIMNDKAIAEKADGVKRMFVAYNRAVMDINADSNKYKDLLVTNVKLPEEIKPVYKVVPFSLTTAPDKADVESVVKWLQDKKILESKLTYEQLVDTSLLPAK